MGARQATPYALPGMLAESARLTSVEIAIAVARAHGGRRFSLPREAEHPGGGVA
jgi:hypothetical protein